MAVRRRSRGGSLTGSTILTLYGSGRPCMKLSLFDPIVAPLPAACADSHTGPSRPSCRPQYPPPLPAVKDPGRSSRWAFEPLDTVPLRVLSSHARAANHLVLGGRDLVRAMTESEPRPLVTIVAAQACLAGLMFAAILVLGSRTSLDFIYFQF